MPVIRMTQKLQKELGLKPADLTPSAQNDAPLAEWYANIFTLNRRKQVIFVERQSLFSFTLADVGRKDLRERLPELFEKGLARALFQEEASAEVIAGVTDVIRREWVVDKTLDRRTIGSMNEFVRHHEYLFDDDRPSDDRDRSNRDMPMKAVQPGNLPYQFPAEMFARVIKTLLDLDFVPRSKRGIARGVPSQIFRFKIVLDDIEPAVWRRIEVGNHITFYQFHMMIQEAMGWGSCHLHEFRDGEFTIGDTRDEVCEFGDPPQWEERDKTIDAYFSPGRRRIGYIYDFGDDWTHTIFLEDIVPVQEDVSYPRCVDGARACPPEDCGGVPGYEHLLEILSNPAHKEYTEMRDWAGDFDPEHFDPAMATEGMRNPFDLLGMF